MKRIISLVITSITLIMLILLIALPKYEFSENENCYLQKLPVFSIDNVLSAKFMQNTTDYISDHFPFREKFLNFKTNLFKILGVKRQNDIYYAHDGYLIEEYKKPLNNEKIVRVVNRFIDNNPNINYDFMLVPTSTYILSNKLSKYNLNYSEEKTILYFKDNFKGNFIDVKDILLENNDKYIYYKTDHHWTTLGAYLAYTLYCNEKKVLPVKDDFLIVNDNFYGTLYSKVIDNSLEPDYIEKNIDNNNYLVEYPNNELNSMYNEEYLNKKDKYSYFLNGNQSLIKVTNPDNKNGELLVIKDSYANSFVPLIANNYHKIHIIDPRYYKHKISDYIKENNIENVLFLYNVGTIDDDFGILSIN